MNSRCCPMRVRSSRPNSEDASATSCCVHSASNLQAGGGKGRSWRVHCIQRGHSGSGTDAQGETSSRGGSAPTACRQAAGRGATKNHIQAGSKQGGSNNHLQAGSRQGAHAPVAPLHKALAIRWVAHPVLPLHNVQKQHAAAAAAAGCCGSAAGSRREQAGVHRPGRTRVKGQPENPV